MWTFADALVDPRYSQDAADRMDEHGLGSTAEFLLLGPLRVRKTGSFVSLGGSRQQTLFAYLCLNANRHITVERLMEAVWGEAAPPSARKNIQLYVSRLRKVLDTVNGADATDGVRLETTSDGYLLTLGRHGLDLARCRLLADRGRELLREGDAGPAAALLGEACRTWRGEALSGLSNTVPIRAEVARIAQFRLSVTCDYFTAQLRVGRYAEMVPDLAHSVTLYPYQERLHGHLMEALWRSGRREEALAAYALAYRRLVDDVGMEPGRSLRALHREILADSGGMDSGTVFPE
ncbi:AfsR/SARP family transcriptional regulator [Streptomyces sp. NPDC055107]